MPHYRCCVEMCNNDSRYPAKIVNRGPIEGEIRWHYFPKDPKRRAECSEQISKGLESFVATNNKVVFSNHFLHCNTFKTVPSWNCERKKLNNSKDEIMILAPLSLVLMRSRFFWMLVKNSIQVTHQI